MALKPGMSNLRPVGQNRAARRFNPAPLNECWRFKKKHKHFMLWIFFFNVLTCKKLNPEEWEQQAKLFHASLLRGVIIPLSWSQRVDRTHLHQTMFTTCWKVLEQMVQTTRGRVKHVSVCVRKHIKENAWGALEELSLCCEVFLCHKLLINVHSSQLFQSNSTCD